MEYDYARFLIELGVRVKSLRKERKLSHRRMIADFGFHLGQLAKIEKGGAVSTQTLLKLCAAFDMTIEQLLDGIGRQERP